MKVDISNISRQEVEALLYATVYDKMTVEEQGIMNSFLYASQDLYIGTVDGEIACVWGCVPPTLLSSQAYIWLYTTELALEHQFTFIRHSQIAVEKLLEKYDFITGTTITGNDRAVRWLKWLGAKFQEPIGRKMSFEIRKKHG